MRIVAILWAMVLAAGTEAASPTTGALVCATPDGQRGAPAAVHTVRVASPGSKTPMLTGAGSTVEVRRFDRGRTIIFDAGTEVLYFDRDNHNFTYTYRRSSKDPVVNWHGVCRLED